ncbi:hypothetical protein AXA44_21910 [Rhodococcus sp. SC4]|nr:hypothetical protein AXA44_21910 [Rhodococcus sp. SC4]
MTDSALVTGADAAVPLRDRKPVWVLLVASFAAFLGGINQSTTNVALPVIVDSLQASAVAATWILLSYLVAMAATILVFGRLADLVGRRRVFLHGTTLFAVSSLAAAVAPSVTVLIIARTVQGVAAAMMFATGAALIAAVYPRRSLGGAMGIFVAVNSIAQFLGPMVGGFVAAGPGWPWLFWANIPVALCAAAAGHFVLPRGGTAARGEGFDFVGAVLAVGVVVALVCGVSGGGVYGWTSPRILALLGGFAVGAAAFVWWEHRIRHPLMDLTLFADRVFRWANVSSLLNCAVRFPLVLLVALMFQTVHSGGPALAGLAVVPISIGTMVASFAYGALERRFSHYRLGIAGSLATTGGVLLLLPTVAGGPYVLLTAVGGLVAGAGAGVVVTANGATILLPCATDQLGAVSSIRALLQMLGNSVGVAACLTLVAAPLPRGDKDAVYAGNAASLAPGSFAALERGFYAALIAVGVLAVAGAVASACARMSARNSRLTDRLSGR